MCEEIESSRHFFAASSVHILSFIEAHNSTSHWYSWGQIHVFQINNQVMSLWKFAGLQPRWPGRVMSLRKGTKVAGGKSYYISQSNVAFTPLAICRFKYIGNVVCHVNFCTFHFQNYEHLSTTWNATKFFVEVLFIRWIEVFCNISSKYFSRSFMVWQCFFDLFMENPPLQSNSANRNFGIKDNNCLSLQLIVEWRAS